AVAIAEPDPGRVVGAGGDLASCGRCPRAGERPADERTNAPGSRPGLVRAAMQHPAGVAAAASAVGVRYLGLLVAGRRRWWRARNALTISVHPGARHAVAAPTLHIAPWAGRRWWCRMTTDVYVADSIVVVHIVIVSI